MPATYPLDAESNHIRAEVRALLDSLGDQPKWSRVLWRIPTGTGKLLDVRVCIRSATTTEVEVDRCRAHDVDPDLVDPWLRDTLWPYATRWSDRTRHLALAPRCGSSTYTNVLTGEVVDLLYVWLPQELAWQRATPPAMDAESNQCHRG